MESNINNKGYRWPVKPLQDSQGFLAVPKEILKLIVMHINNFDALMLRSSCKSLFNSHLELHPFPKHFVLDQNECAAYFIKLGSISCLEYLKSLNFFFTIDLAITAASNNQLEALKFLRNNGCRLNPQVAIEAARIGNLEMLKYCLENISNKIDMKTNQGMSLCYVAATAGHVHVLKYLHENGYEWDQHTPYMATCFNHLECLKYAVDEGCPVTAVTLTSLETMKFMNERGLDWKPHACENAVQAKNLEMLKYAHENGAPWGEAVHYAIANGSLDCLKYIIENGAQVQQAFEKVGSLDVLKYLVEHVPGAGLLPELYRISVENAQKDMLEYLPKLIDLARPNSLGTLAAGCGDLEFLKWCIEEQHYDTDTWTHEEGDTEDILDVALGSMNFECVKYVIEKNLGPRVKNHFEHVEYGLSYYRTSDIWDYMYKIEKFDIVETMMRIPIQAGVIEVLEWMKQHGAKFDEKHVVIAIQSRNVSSMAWLLKQGIKFSIGCEYGNTLCFKYAHEHGYPWSPDAVNQLGDNVDLLRYMVHCGHVTPSPELYHKAKSKGHVNVLAYLDELGVSPTLKSTIKNIFSKFRK